jgi:hypothetical protein
MEKLPPTTLSYTIAALFQASGIGRPEIYGLEAGRLQAKKHGKGTIVLESKIALRRGATSFWAAIRTCAQEAKKSSRAGDAKRPRTMQ